VLVDDTNEASVPMPPTVMVSKAPMGGVLAALEARGMALSVFTRIVLALIESMTVGSCTQHSCRKSQHGTANESCESKERHVLVLLQVAQSETHKPVMTIMVEMLPEQSSFKDKWH
jgi:hypothetical protein